MFKPIKKSALALLTVSLLFACSKSSQTPQPEIDQPDPIDPVEFSFLTINKSGMYGEPSSISFIDKKGNVQLDQYKQANGVQIADDPTSAVQIGNSLYLLQASRWDGSSLQELNPNTLQLINKIDLGKDIVPRQMVHLGKDSVMMLCSTNNLDYDIVVGSLSSEKFITKGLFTDLNLTAINKIGNKVFAVGATSSTSAERTKSSLVVFDIDNITLEGMRVINNNISIYSNRVFLLEDKNGIVWFLNDETPLKFVGFDPKTEQIVNTIELPTVLNTLSGISYCIDNAKENIYFRTKKSFCKMNLVNTQSPDEPIYEFLNGQRNFVDIKMTLDGKILTIDNVLNANSPSVVYEFSINGDKWENSASYEVDCGAVLLYIPVN